MNDEVAIKVKNVTKTYQLYNSHADRVKEAFHPLRKKYHRPFNALTDVSFQVEKGEFIGIIGRNGSGKSTLLQIICGILHPTLGSVEVNGRIAALLELGAGFNPEFTGRENVYLRASIMGLSKETIDAKFDEIAVFADIGEFIDQPVKIYSTGMMMRLAFAVQTSIEARVFVIDEVLAVGDAKFQRKCFSRLLSFHQGGGTIILVSHDMNTVCNFCNWVILLENGMINSRDKPKRITVNYHRLLFQKEDLYPPLSRNLKAVCGEDEEGQCESVLRNSPHGESDTDYEDPYHASTSEIDLKERSDRQHDFTEMRYGNKKAEIVDAGILDDNGRRTLVLESGGRYCLFFRTLFHEALTDIVIGFLIRNPKGVDLFGLDTLTFGLDVPPQEKGAILESRLHVKMWFHAGEYLLTVALARSDSFKYDIRFDAIHFTVIGDGRLFTTSVVNLEPNLVIQQV